MQQTQGAGGLPHSQSNGSIHKYMIEIQKNIWSFNLCPVTAFLGLCVCLCRIMVAAVDTLVVCTLAMARGTAPATATMWATELIVVESPSLWVAWPLTSDLPLPSYCHTCPLHRKLCCLFVCLTGGVSIDWERVLESNAVCEFLLFTFKSINDVLY